MAKMRWLPACVTYIWLLLASADPADKYLSDSYFPGMHILERHGDQLKLYREGSKPTTEKPALTIEASWKTMEEARAALEKALSIPAREPYQSDWAMFTSQGRRIETIEDLQSRDLAFITEIGQWIWPAVHVGFEQVAQEVDGDRPKVLKTLSLRPVAFDVKDFISPEECDTIIKLGGTKNLIASEGVMQSADLAAGVAHSEFRTSKQAWLSTGDDDVIHRLDRRTANLTRVHYSHNEDVQLLRYGEGNYYHGHMDWSELELYNDQAWMWKQYHFGHQDRLGNVFWYLNDVPEGGETIFLKHNHSVCPTYEQRNCDGSFDPPMESCDIPTALKVRPTRGSVLLWYNYHASGRGDRNSLHSGCPVGSGLIKWSANKWFSIKPFRTPPVAWMDDHPALKRMGWTGTGANGQAMGDPNKCKVTFVNKFQQDTELVWIGPDSEAMLATIKPGKSSSLDSFRGHKFKVRTVGGGKQSKEVTCKKEPGSFVLTKDFKLGWLSAEKAGKKQGKSEL
eukprot:TRINITY_DN90474_c0_g1_i1.p1 TRINITY_DN90474_c0_g1~~TRINITY_DN90474_c0_g1_i1.p1  ORF type:complete len:530 (+),score=116.00 TRINITY_DN90474_c0_g1_i1:64-1590(+)